jgi:hypothetical protein
MASTPSTSGCCSAMTATNIRMSNHRRAALKAEPHVTEELQRNNVHLWFNSKRYALSELSGCVSVSIHICSFRLRNGWPTSSAIFFPVKAGISYMEVGNFMRQKKELNTYSF